MTGMGESKDETIARLEAELEFAMRVMRAAAARILDEELSQPRMPEYRVPPPDARIKITHKLMPFVVASSRSYGRELTEVEMRFANRVLLKATGT